MTEVLDKPQLTWHESQVTREQRYQSYGQTGVTLWLTGLSGAGKSTLAFTLERMLIERKKMVYVLDGDNIRQGLNAGLSFSAEDRAENIRRVGEVAKLFSDAGTIVIASLISPYTSDRRLARQSHAQWDLPFVEVHVKTPLAVCEERDPKGLYQKARAGVIKGFTGIDDPYNEPEAAEIVVDADQYSPVECAEQVLDYLSKHDLLK